MSTRVHAALQSLAAAVVFAAPVAVADPVPTERVWLGDPAGPGQVLTLEGAAQFLGVEPADLRDLAVHAGVPGRQIGGEWRFSRRALLAWLGGADFPESDAIESDELASFRARGPGEAAPEERPIGEAPKYETAEQVFLRDQRLLLGPGQVVLEPAVFLSRTDDRDQIGIDGVPGFGSLLFPGLVVEQDTLTTALIGRYGLLEETELFAGALFQLQKSHIEIFGQEAFDDSNSLSGFSLGARRTLVRERRGIPDVILSIDGFLPTHNGSYKAGAGLSLVKSFDPLVMFGGLEYRHTFSRDFSDVTLLEPKDQLGLTLGYAFAVNDELTLSTAVSGLFERREEFSARTLDGTEEFSLRFGLTRMMARGRYIEPSVTFGLNGAGSSFTLGLSMPYLIRE